MYCTCPYQEGFLWAMKELELQTLGYITRKNFSAKNLIKTMAKHKKRYNPKKFAAIIQANITLVEKRKSAPMSDGEKRIANWLSANNLEFQREYYMKGLYSPKTGFPLFFDFYLPKYKIAIEFDGRHHFQPTYGQKEFEGQRLRDGFKNYFCKKNNIKMIRIPCFRQNKTAEILLKQMSDFLADKK